MKDEEGTELSVEADDEVMEKFLAGARASGMRAEVCMMCTRPFLTRDKSRLCPPCRHGKPDGWSPAHSVRSIEFGSCLPVEGMSTCPDCRGLGVIGWQPGGPTPHCPRCRGRGQVEP